jgi:regulation of enolase protein 1 (concanavalin A-like superfamily)
MNDTPRSKSVPANRPCLAMMETLEGRTLLCATDHEIAAFPASHLAGEYVAGVSATSLLAGTGTVSAQVAPSLAAATGVIAGLPAGWASRDIGSGVRAGSTTETAGGAYTVVGGGTDIYGAADSFRFAYGVLNGDGQIIARVDSVQLTHASAKAGVMIRESLAANSRNGSVVIKGGTGAVMQSRTATADPTNYNKVNGPAAPEWVKLVRAGDKLTGYYSADGATWQSLGTRTIAMSSTVYVGLAVTAHDAAKLNTSSFSNVSVVPAGHPGSGAWTGTGVDIGNVGKAGYSSTGADGTVTVAGAGADIWNSSDAFRFNYQKLTGDGSIVARVTSQQNTDPWAKAGIMLRETLATNSKFAFAAVTPANGTFFGSRTSTGGMAKRVATSSYSLPLWLKLTRTGSTIVGYRSTNGTTWTELGRATISMNGTVHVGLAVTSHRAGTLSTAKFDNVAVTVPTPQPPPTGSYEWTPLFNGQNLDGFYTYTERQGTDNDTKGYFKVENGMIHATDLPAGSTAEFGYLATSQTYSNYHLRFQYKWGEKKFNPRLNTVRDAGVLFHVNGADQLWPQSVEAQIQEGDTGDLWLLGVSGKEPTATVTVENQSVNPRKFKAGGTAYTQRGNRIVKGSTPESLTDWNTVEVIAEGQNATVMVNGVVVMRMTNLRRPDPNDSSRLVALTRGRIAFQTEGAEIFYRDIQIRQVGQTSAPTGASTIFDGTSTAGLIKRDGSTGAIPWTIQNGALVVKPGSGDVRTKQSFAGDYRLHVEFRTNVRADSVTEQDRGNSGIGLAGSYEVQVLDSYNRAIADQNDLGAIYGIANPDVNAALPAGVWQSYDIDFTAAKWEGTTKVADARLTVRLNGVLIQDNVAVPNSTYTFEAEQPGARPIIFQDHANSVEYRNIWLAPK